MGEYKRDARRPFRRSTWLETNQTQSPMYPSHRALKEHGNRPTCTSKALSPEVCAAFKNQKKKEPPVSTSKAFSHRTGSLATVIHLVFLYVCPAEFFCFSTSSHSVFSFSSLDSGNSRGHCCATQNHPSADGRLNEQSCQKKKGGEKKNPPPSRKKGAPCDCDSGGLPLKTRRSTQDTSPR